MIIFFNKSLTNNNIFMCLGKLMKKKIKKKKKKSKKKKRNRKEKIEIEGHHGA